jgi:acetyl-CoA carboxylase biotin carboxyl carrier protein
MRIEEVRRLIRLVEESEIGELEVWKWWGRIRIRKEASANGSAVHVIGAGDYVPRAAAPAAPVADAAPVPAPEPAKAAEEEKGITVVKSPMVGTFYRAPAPDAEPYVQPGDTVEPGQTICIIEAMKLMNEIQSEVRGKIVKILVDNAHAVEFGQDLFHVKTD